MYTDRFIIFLYLAINYILPARKEQQYIECYRPLNFLNLHVLHNMKRNFRVGGLKDQAQHMSRVLRLVLGAAVLIRCVLS